MIVLKPYLQSFASRVLGRETKDVARTELMRLK